jgi:hypothetical protein
VHGLDQAVDFIQQCRHLLDFVDDNLGGSAVSGAWFFRLRGDPAAA